MKKTNKKFITHYSLPITKKGFTLIELLAVIFIIGVLAAIVIVSLGNARKKARDARRITDLDTIRTALEMYYEDHNIYPYPVTDNTCWLQIRPDAENCGTATGGFETLIKLYLFPLPGDPLDSGYNRYEINIPMGPPYDGSVFWLRTRVEVQRNANLGRWCYGVHGGQPFLEQAAGQAICDED